AQEFNDYEQRLFQPEIQPKSGQVSIAIGAAGHKHPASQSRNVICTAILVDGEEINLHDFAKPPLLSKGELRFGEQDSLSFIMHARSHVGFRFRTDTGSGVVFAEINGKRTEHDLYQANVEAKFTQLDHWLLQPDGAFTLTADLPRYPVRTLEILNVRPSRTVRLLTAELHGKGNMADLLHGQPAELGSLHFAQPLQSMKSYFHPLQFAQQILFALLSSWLLTALLKFTRELGGLRGMFLAEQRQWFWLMFAASLTVFGTWLAAFWPGVMSVDSMKIWRAALLPDVYLNDHPLLNIFLYKYLRHLWSNTAVVPVAQVFLSSLLAAWFGFWLYRQKLRLAAILLWLFSFCCSVPVGIYNTLLWKDIPFAMLVVFWACILVKLRQEKQQNNLRWTVQRIIALLLLGLALGLIRHNGLIYLVVLPALLLLLRLVPLKKALIGVAALLLISGTGFLILHFTDRSAENSFLLQEIRKYTADFSTRNITQNAKLAANDYMTVLDIRQAAQKWDKLHYYLQDRQAWWFLKLSG
ncbi:hypothetical protein VU07_04660, partial [Desulfobulbus sp. F4]|nr:hypothetical protein [Desulfobulbus sp. F4]